MTTTASILKRLSAINAAAPVIDFKRAEAAVAQHLQEFGLPSRPARWIPDGVSGFYDILSPGWERHRATAAAWGAHSSLMHRITETVEEGLDPAYAAALKRLLPRPSDREDLPEFDAIPALACWSARWIAAWDAGGRILKKAGLIEGSAPYVQAMRALAANGSALCVDPVNLTKSYLCDRSKRKPLAPLVDAVEAGLWQFWPTPTETLLFPRPALRLVGGNLHDEHGPALLWPGASCWALFGQRVDREVVESPATLDLALVDRAWTAYVRGIILERYGRDRYLSELRGSVVAESPAGRLIRFQPPDREPFAMVEVRRTPQAAVGEYVRVPTSIATPEEGLAWTFGLTVAEYPLRPLHYHLYESEEIGPAAREIIDRLRRLDHSNPVLDRKKAEAALACRFPSVSRGETTVEWVDCGPAVDRCGRRLRLDDEAAWEPALEATGIATRSAWMVTRLMEDRNAEHEMGWESPEHLISYRASQAAGVAMLIHQGDLTLGEDQFRADWIPWVELYEAGVFALWTSSGQILALPRTELQPGKRRRRGDED